MTVQELINQLQQFDPNTSIVCSINDHTDFNYKVHIESIEVGNPYDEAGINVLDGSESDYDLDYHEDEDTGEETYIGPKCIVFELGSI